jgi:hypothetical protein
VSALERLLAGALLLAALAVGGWFGLQHYGTERYDAGYAAAVAAGQAQHDRDVVDAHKTESDLRAQLRALDADHYREEQEYATKLADAQRRVRAGTDRLHCPAADPVPAPAAPGAGPAASAPATDAPGPELVPEAAADVLGHGAAIASIVRRYDEVVEQYDICRAVNAR